MYSRNFHDNSYFDSLLPGQRINTCGETIVAYERYAGELIMVLHVYIHLCYLCILMFH